MSRRVKESYANGSRLVLVLACDELVGGPCLASIRVTIVHPSSPRRRPKLARPASRQPRSSCKVRQGQGRKHCQGVGLSGRLWGSARDATCCGSRRGAPRWCLLSRHPGKTVADLSKKEPAALTTAADQAKKVKKITEKPPTEPQFQDWIDQAKNLPPVLEAK